MIIVKNTYLSLKVEIRTKDIFWSHSSENTTYSSLTNWLWYNNQYLILNEGLSKFSKGKNGWNWEMGNWTKMSLDWVDQ